MDKKYGSTPNSITVSNSPSYNVSNNFGRFTVNSVLMTNVTMFSLIKNSSVASLIGNITYNVTTQHNEAKGFYTFSNIGKDGKSIGVGLNYNDWYGFSAYITSDISFGSSWQLTPVISGSYGWDLSNGLSIGAGITIGNKTHEVNVSIGNGTLLGFAICGTIAATPIPGARVLAGAAAGIILLIDIFN